MASAAGPDEAGEPTGLSRPSRPDNRCRVVKLNSSQAEKYVGNRISTAKYSFWSFVPSFLFEQFRRYSNIFFLLIALLQVKKFGKYKLCMSIWKKR